MRFGMSRSQQRDIVDFVEEAIADLLKRELDNAIDWGNLIALIAEKFGPEEVFSEKDLEYWAENNGYTRE